MPTWTLEAWASMTPETNPSAHPLSPQYERGGYLLVPELCSPPAFEGTSGERLHVVAVFVVQLRPLRSLTMGWGRSTDLAHAVAAAVQDARGALTRLRVAQATDRPIAPASSALAGEPTAQATLYAQQYAGFILAPRLVSYLWPDQEVYLVEVDLIEALTLRIRSAPRLRGVGSSLESAVNEALVHARRAVDAMRPGRRPMRALAATRCGHYLLAPRLVYSACERGTERHIVVVDVFDDRTQEAIPDKSRRGIGSTVRRACESALRVTRTAIRGAKSPRTNNVTDEVAEETEPTT